MKSRYMKREIILKVDGLDIAGQLYRPDKAGPPYPAVILCHGIPSGIVDPSDGGYPLLADTIAAAGFAVLTFNFRGSGASQGDFNIAGWSRDLKSAVDYIWDLEEIDRKHISLTGFSAGATISIYVAARDKRVSAVAACACPADFSAISEAQNPQLSLNYFRKIGIIRDSQYPPVLADWLADFRRINALQSVAEIAPRPLLLLHARQDPVVPVENAEKLYQQAKEPKILVIIEGAEHRLRRNEKAVRIIIGWLKENS
jgi:uncharacterized protein